MYTSVHTCRVLYSIYLNSDISRTQYKLIHRVYQTTSNKVYKRNTNHLCIIGLCGPTVATHTVHLPIELGQAKSKRVASKQFE